MTNNRTTKRHLPPSSYSTGYSGSSSFISDPSNDGSLMPQARADITITASHPRLGIPKSRTFSVLSSLTQSFSRGSLTSRGASSRNVSGESYASNTAVPVPGAAHEVSFQPTRQLDDAAPSTSATPALLPTSRLPDSPKAITTAMPPQYWAGRFMALHDRFHNELLEPHYLTRICEAQAQSPLPDCGSRAPAAAQNNPSTSVYALARLGRTSKHIPGQHSSPRQPSRIPQSATTGAILQSTPCSIPSHLHPTSPPSLNKRGTAQRLLINSNNHHPPTTTANKTKPDPIPPPTTTAKTTTLKEPEPLPDDNALTRRALLHLAQHCATPAARASLVAWQVSYAHKTGRACFLPGTTTTTTTASCCLSGSSLSITAGAFSTTTGAAAAVASVAAVASCASCAGGGGAAAAGDGGTVAAEDGNDCNTSGVRCTHNSNNDIIDSNTLGVSSGSRCVGGGGDKQEEGKQVPLGQQDGREFGRRGREMVRRLRRGLGSKTKSEVSGHHAAAGDMKDRMASDGCGGVHGLDKGSTASSEVGLEELRVEKEKGRKGGRFGFFMG